MEKELVVESILQRLTELNRSIPRRKSPASRREHVETSRMTAGTMDEFEAEAIADALEGMVTDLEAVLDEAAAKVYEQCLDVYYTAEEMARTPEHAPLAAHVERMRAAYEQSYGRAVPTREETEARRKASPSTIA
ncbi:MAG TPA: hypothetical protein VNA69_18995 [Thermoanaerobaculia bacterium]|nr:hypothetical protein [Thermoanaerobaculia bacterium]